MEVASAKTATGQQRSGVSRILFWLSWAVPLLIVIAFVAAPPWSLLDKTRLVGYAVCHQIPERSFFIAGEQLPLCSRCSGTFLGAFAGFAVLTARGRRRAANLPPLPVTIVLIAFILAMAVDGVNSYLTFFPGAFHLYQPHNLLRLTTGTLSGLALSNIIYPILNYTLWRDATEEPALRSFRELGLIVIVAGTLSGLVALEPPLLLYPLALLSTLGVLLLLGSVNAVLALTVTRREGKASRWRHLLWPALVGLAAALTQITLIDLARATLTRALGLPF